MGKLATLMAAGAVLAACASVPDEGRSCAELAQTRADGQMEREIALLEQEESGLPDKSELRRKFIAMDAESHRVAVLEECRRRRGLAAEDE